MLTKIIAIVCFIALRVGAYEEILPTQTLDLESRDEGSCQRYHGEVRVNNRRIGFLSFNSEDSAGVTRDRRAATVLHADSNGRPRAGKSFIGTRRSARGYTSLKSLPKKKGALSELGGSLCYSSKTRTIYSGSTPQRLECKPITITPSCGRSRLLASYILNR